jgi:hypothetical protein
MATRYRLVDQDGNTFDITDPTFRMLDDSASIEADIVERSFRAGADFPGIQRDESKELNFVYSLNNSNEQTFRNYYNQLTYWFRKTRYIQDIINNIETEVLYVDRSIGYDNGGFNKGAENNETFRQLRPFWEDIDYQEEEETGITSDTIILNNNGYYETPALITIQALEQITKISMRINETGNGIIIKDLQFGVRGLNTYVIDNKDGTIELNQILRNQKIQSGTGFFNLRVGVNTMVIQLNGQAEVTIRFKRRYYI